MTRLQEKVHMRISNVCKLLDKISPIWVKSPHEPTSNMHKSSTVHCWGFLFGGGGGVHNVKLSFSEIRQRWLYATYHLFEYTSKCMFDFQLDVWQLNKQCKKNVVPSLMYVILYFEHVSCVAGLLFIA